MRADQRVCCVNVESGGSPIRACHVCRAPRHPAWWRVSRCHHTEGAKLSSEHDLRVIAATLDGFVSEEQIDALESGDCRPVARCHFAKR